MKKVYAVFGGEYSDTELMQIYASEQKANQFVEEDNRKSYKRYEEDFAKFLNDEFKPYSSSSNLFVIRVDEFSVSRRTSPLSFEDSLNTPDKFLYNFDYYYVQECDFDDCPDFLKDQVE